MKKILGIAAVAFGLSLIAASPVLASQGNPHQEEQDGCDHGNSNKPCKDDPQPDHGSECDVHGNHGGVNEDHCNGTTTTTAPPTTTTTAPVVDEPTTTTTAPSVVVVSDPDPVVPAVTPVPATDTPAPQATPVVEAPVSAPVTPEPITELPHTGSAALLLTMIGTGMVFAGAGLKAVVA